MKNICEQRVSLEQCKTRLCQGFQLPGNYIKFSTKYGFPSCMAMVHLIFRISTFCTKNFGCVENTRKIDLIL